jgi:methylated-DNA-protein-cysteine methyltransferase-like protein
MPTQPPPPVDVGARADALSSGQLRWRGAVEAVVRAIPPGRVLGYGQVAALLGRPRAARQVGFALAALGPGTTVPWWRVLRSDGSIALQGDPTRGPLQAAALRAEGIAVVDFTVDMAAVGWRPGP